MNHDPVMSDLNMYLNEIDRQMAIWESYEEWAQNRTDAEKVKAYEEFIYGGTKSFSGQVSWIGRPKTAVFGIAGIKCQPSEAFEEWDYETNWPDNPDKQR